MLSLDSKQCSKCQHTKSVLEFSKYYRSPDKLAYWCKQCHKQYGRVWELHNKKDKLPYRAAKRREWRKKNPGREREAQRKNNLRQRFELDLEDYNKLKEMQNDLCAVCRQSEFVIEGNSRQIKNLTVDHCHKTGDIRGLLCHKCNLGLGHFNDNVEQLKAAIRYLERT